MPLLQGRRLAPSLAALAVAVGLGLTACGGTPTATPPPPTLAPTVAPATAVPTAPPATATGVPTRPAASGTATAARPTGGTPGTPSTPANATPNPVAVIAAYSNLQKQPSYHLEIRAEGIGTLVPLGIGNTLVYTIDANGGNQKIVIDDGSGTKQEGYKVGNKYYLVTDGVVAEQTSLPLIFTLPDILYNSLTAPGVMTFTSAGSEEVKWATDDEVQRDRAGRQPRHQPALRARAAERAGGHRRPALGRYRRELPGRRRSHHQPHRAAAGHRTGCGST